MGKLITALKWFAYGLGLGLLLAPRSGKETRQQLIQSISGTLSGAMSSAGQTINQAAGKTQQGGSSGHSNPYNTEQSSVVVESPSYGVREASGPSSTTISGGPA